MTTFVAGKPQTTDKPAVVVDAGLAAGLHRFRLVVVDAAGNESKPDEVVVEVRSGRVITGGTTGVITGAIAGGTVTPALRPTGSSPAPLTSAPATPAATTGKSGKTRSKK